VVGLLRPPERLTVSQAASKYRRLNNPGSYSGPWSNSLVRYMVEPMDELTSAIFNALVFVGPAQSAKTDCLLINWQAYGVVCDPMDMIMYSPSGAAARDFSIRRVDRLHRHSPEVGSKLRTTRDADNKFDKHYKNGMLVTLSWPSSTEMAGKPVPRVALTDYDRMEENIDGEGSPFDLASKRTTTFGSFAMTVAESSPSRELTDHRWIARTPHEAPPTTGILALYNRGDRRRWYWPCPHCSKFFEGEFSMLEWDDQGDDMTTAETVRMICPKCGEAIKFEDRHEMQQWGFWLKDGQGIDDKFGRPFGKPFRSSIASFWLKGVAAAFVTWKKLVETYLVALREFENTGDEEALKKFYNTDLAEVYIPKSLENERIPEHLKARAEKFCEDDERVVPEGVRALIATVDVQKNMFVAQVHGVLPGNPFDLVLVDRFDIRKSKRTDDDGDVVWVKPGSYLEDWDEIETQVMDKSYPLQGDPSRRMGIKLTLCDSGGKEGVTTNAYNFYRTLRDRNKHGRFHLVKGDPLPNHPRARVTYPDAIRKDRNAGARGDVPVLMINSNLMKDALAHRLDCIEPGKGMYRFPSWVADWWYREMCAEVRTPKGWENSAHTRNEAWDLSYYCLGGCVSKLLLIERIDWSNAPGWAAEWDSNDLIHKADEAKRFAEDRPVEYDYGKFGALLA
jgi:phage terminase large subunit GpA-like protein